MPGSSPTGVRAARPYFVSTMPFTAAHASRIMRDVTHFTGITLAIDTRHYLLVNVSGRIHGYGDALCLGPLIASFSITANGKSVCLVAIRHVAFRRHSVGGE